MIIFYNKNIMTYFIIKVKHKVLYLFRLICADRGGLARFAFSNAVAISNIFVGLPAGREATWLPLRSRVGRSA